MTNAAFYADLVETADGLLREFGAPGKLVRGAVSTYDPATGATSSPPVVSNAIVAAVFDYDEHLINGSIIQVGDKQVYVSVKGGLREPRATDQFVWPDSDPETYTIVKHKELGPAGINVLYEWQVRK